MYIRRGKKAQIINILILIITSEIVLQQQFQHRDALIIGVGRLTVRTGAG